MSGEDIAFELSNGNEITFFMTAYACTHLCVRTCQWVWAHARNSMRVLVQGCVDELLGLTNDVKT